MTVVSMCHVSLARVVRRPSLAWPGAGGAGDGASRTCAPGDTGRGRSPDLAEPLRQDGERAGRSVPVLERGHHVLDGLDLAWSKTTGRRVRTGRLIVKRARMLQPSPRMESTRRQSKEPQECPQRHKLADAIHRSQDPG